MIDNKTYRTIEYYLYEYNELDKMIYEIENDLLLPTNYSYDNWLQSKHKDTCTLENQVIRAFGEYGKGQAHKVEKVVDPSIGRVQGSQ